MRELSFISITVGHHLECRGGSFNSVGFRLAGREESRGLKFRFCNVVTAANSADVNGAIRSRIYLDFCEQFQRQSTYQIKRSMYQRKDCLQVVRHSRCVPKRSSSPQNNAVASTEPSAGGFHTILVLFTPSIGNCTLPSNHFSA